MIIERHLLDSPLLSPEEYQTQRRERRRRAAVFEVVAQGQPGKVFALLTCGWEMESFYRKRMPRVRPRIRACLKMPS